MAKEMEIAYTTRGMEESIVKQLNKWIQNGHGINNSFIKIVHNGAFYTMFYDADLDNLVKE
jgi:hypothetical protein